MDNQIFNGQASTDAAMKKASVDILNSIDGAINEK
jgi:hypothetical protein